MPFLTASVYDAVYRVGLAHAHEQARRNPHRPVGRPSWM